MDSKSTFNKKLLALAVSGAALSGGYAYAETNICDNDLACGPNSIYTGGSSLGPGLTNVDNLGPQDVHIVGENSSDLYTVGTYGVSTGPETPITSAESDTIPQSILDDGWNNFLGAFEPQTEWTVESSEYVTSEVLSSAESIVHFGETGTSWDYSSTVSETTTTSYSDVYRVYEDTDLNVVEAEWGDSGVISETSIFSDQGSHASIDQDGFFVLAHDQLISDGVALESDVAYFAVRDSVITGTVSDQLTGDSSRLTMFADEVSLTQNGHGLHIASDVTTVSGGVNSTNTQWTEDAIINNGDTVINGGLDVSGVAVFSDTVYMQGALDVDGPTWLDGTLDVDGSAEFDSDVSIAQGLSVTGGTDTDTLNVSDTSTFGGLATFNGGVDVASGDLTVSDNVTIAGNLDVDGDTTLDDTTVDGTLDVTGAATFESTVDVGGSLTVSDVSNLWGDVNVGGDIDLFNDGKITTGNITIDGTTDTITVGGNTTTIQDGLVTVNGVGAGSYSGTTTIDGGRVTTNNGVYTNYLQASDAYVSNDLNVGEDLTVGDELDVGGAATFSDTVTVEGHTQLNGGLTAEGAGNYESSNSVAYFTTNYQNTDGLGTPWASDSFSSPSDITRQIDQVPNWFGQETQTAVTSDSNSAEETIFEVNDAGIFGGVASGHSDVSTVTTEYVDRHLESIGSDIVAVTVSDSTTTTTHDVDIDAGEFSLTETMGQLSVSSFEDNRVITDGELVSGEVTATSGDLNVTATSASLTVTNALGNTHGLEVGTTSTTLSGGTTSTYMTLDDNGVTFENDEGEPVKVTGVANGTSTYDAVNYGQFSSFQSDINSQLDYFASEVESELSSLKKDMGDLEDELSAGIAISNAMEVFLPDPGKKFRMNIGGGYYNGESAIGITGSGRVGKDGATALYFGVGSGTSGGEVGGKVGVSFQW
jgi:cytoskeletal protein CcmA (bactofilin family)